MTNQELSNFIGYTMKEKVLMDATKILLENKAKKLGFLPRPAEVSLVVCHENGEIKGIGGSKPNDIFNNNYGNILRGWFRPATSIVVILDDDGGVPRNIQLGGSGSAWNNDTGGSRFQVGQGTTAPSRSDLAIETPFANTGPEDSLQNSNVGGYASGLGQITITATIGPTAGTGTVSETVDMWHFQDVTTSVPRNFLMAHDAISPGVSFVVAQTLTVQYTWQL